MRKRILADYERNVFSGEVRLHPGQEHSKVRGTERLGFAKLDLYPNAKSKSTKPIRLVGGRAAAEQEIVVNSLVCGWIELCAASLWASNSFVVLKKDKGKWRLVVMRLPCSTCTPSLSLKMYWNTNPNTRSSLLLPLVKGSIQLPFTLIQGL